MKRDTFTLPLAFPGELIVDNFAGGGGTSEGLERAFGRPVNIANDHAEKFDEAHCVLYALSEQYRDLRSWTARAPQLQVVKDAMEIFEIQLSHVAQGEFERTVEKLKRRVQQALKGNGGNVTLVEALA